MVARSDILVCSFGRQPPDLQPPRTVIHRPGRGTNPRIRSHRVGDDRSDRVGFDHMLDHAAERDDGWGIHCGVRPDGGAGGHQARCPGAARIRRSDGGDLLRVVDVYAGSVPVGGMLVASSAVAWATSPRVGCALRWDSAQCWGIISTQQYPQPPKLGWLGCCRLLWRQRLASYKNGRKNWPHKTGGWGYFQPIVMSKPTMNSPNPMR